MYSAFSLFEQTAEFFNTFILVQLIGSIGLAVGVIFELDMVFNYSRLKFFPISIIVYFFNQPECPPVEPCNVVEFTRDYRQHFEFIFILLLWTINH